MPISFVSLTCIDGPYVPLPLVLFCVPPPMFTTRVLSAVAETVSQGPLKPNKLCLTESPLPGSWKRDYQMQCCVPLLRLRMIILLRTKCTHPSWFPIPSRAQLCRPRARGRPLAPMPRGPPRARSGSPPESADSCGPRPAQARAAVPHAAVAGRPALRRPALPRAGRGPSGPSRASSARALEMHLPPTEP